jgi:YD repeat-containing protein
VTSTEYRQDFPFIGRAAHTVVTKIAEPQPDACTDPDASGCFVSPVCQTGETCQSMSSSAPSALGGGGQTLSDAGNTWTSTPAFVATTVQSLTPYLSDSVEQKYDLTTPDLLSHGIHSQFTMDVWGNLISATVYSQRAQSGTLIIDETQTTANVYGCTLSPPTTSGCVGGNLNAERQRLGRLSISTVTTARPAQSAVVRRASFEYDATTLQLVSEIQGPYADEPAANRPRVELRTDRMLDADGNATLEVVCSVSHFANRNACLNLAGFDQRQWEADPTKIQRYRRMRYDDKGRFVLGTLAPFYDPNASNHAIEDFSELIGIDVTQGLVRVPTSLNLVPKRNTFGDPLNHVNAAGVLTDIAYGALGRERFKRGVLGEFSKTTYSWCTDAVITGIPSGAPRANCPVGAVFRVTTDSTGTTGTFNGKSVAPTMWAYFDRMGREMLKTTRIYQQSPTSTSRWSSVATTYDLTGRAKVVTVPYFSKDPAAAQSTARAGTPISGTPKNTTVDYDAIGRAEKTVNPETPSNGSSETVFAYDALKVDVTNPRNNLTSRIMNGRDESVSVQEPGGLTVSFGRDAVGDLKSVSRTPTDGDSANTQIKTDLVHDRLGRKTQISDPDKGGWTYKYNALGELVEQIDAKNQVQKLYRDALGRLIKRTETRWPSRRLSGRGIPRPDRVTSARPWPACQYSVRCTWKPSASAAMSGRSTTTTAAASSKARRTLMAQPTSSGRPTMKWGVGRSTSTRVPTPTRRRVRLPSIPTTAIRFVCARRRAARQDRSTVRSLHSLHAARSRRNAFTMPRISALRASTMMQRAGCWESTAAPRAPSRTGPTPTTRTPICSVAGTRRTVTTSRRR